MTDRQVGQLTAAQRAAAYATLDRIRALLLQVPELARPRGFEMEMDYWGGSRKLGPDQKPIPGSVAEYMVRATFYYPVRKGVEGSVCITVIVNRQNAVPGGDMWRDATGRRLFVEVERGQPVPHSWQAWSGLSEDREVKSSVTVLLAPADAPIVRHATREEYYAAVMREREAPSRSVQQALEKTPYQSWMEGAPERREIREQQVAEAARQGPEYAAKVRDELEKVDREVTETLKASDTSDRERNQEAQASLSNTSAAMQAELDRMTPEERRQPAYVSGVISRDTRSATGWQVLNGGEESGGRRVLTWNYDFWRARRSPVEVSSITVLIEAADTGQEPPVHAALWATYRKLDWAALAALVERRTDE